MRVLMKERMHKWYHYDVHVTRVSLHRTHHFNENGTINEHILAHEPSQMIAVFCRFPLRV